MTTTPGFRMDPRIRERRIAVQRAIGRRRLRILLVGASTLIALGIAFLVVNSPILDVDRVEVVGARHLRVADVRAATRVHHRDALLFVDTGAVARRVEHLPWVKNAVVRRDFPGTLRVTVTEYEPTAYVRSGSAVVLIASNGRAVARVKAPPAGATQVLGVVRAPDVGELLSPPESANVIPQLPRALATQVVALNVAGTDLALELARGGAIRLGNTSELAAKADAALAVLAKIGDTRFAYIDVSTPSTPVLHR
jgi:cell division protein FtsQ